MARKILSEVDIPRLDEAVAARGYALVRGVPAYPECDDVAAILRAWRPGAIVLGSPVPQIAIAPCSASLADALDAGAADAVLNPADPDELAARLDARVRNHLRRELRVGDLVIDRLHRRVTRAGRAIDLRAREYALLLHLAQRAGVYVSRDELLDAVWDLRFDPGTNVIAVHVSKLRARIDRPFATPMLRCIKGVGYSLAPG